MCDWKPDFDRIDQRVDGMEKRLLAVEQAMSTMHGEITTGFADVKAELGHIYAERAKWSEWAREHLGRALRWIGLIVLAACGITQIDKVIAAIK